MESSSHTADGLPRGQLLGQSSFYDIDDPEWVAMLLRRMAAGDHVVLERDGSLVIFTP